METGRADPDDKEMDKLIQQPLARVGFEVLLKQYIRLKVLKR